MSELHDEIWPRGAPKSTPIKQQPRLRCRARSAIRLGNAAAPRHTRFYGIGVPRGDGSGVIMIPGFMGTDIYLMDMYAWLERIGYRAYYSGIRLNAECPNLLIKRRLTATIDRARDETGQPVPSDMGTVSARWLARSAARQRTVDIASVITLGAPFRGTVVHYSRVLKVAEIVRTRILEHARPRRSAGLLHRPLHVQFHGLVKKDLPDSISQTAIYTKSDGVVDWQYCITDDPAVDVEVPGTHIGLAFNPVVYEIIANRLAAAKPQ